MSDLSLELLTGLLEPLDLLNHNLLVRLPQLALEPIVLLKLRVLVLDVAELADPIGLQALELVLHRAVAAAGATARATVVAEGGQSKGLIAELAIVLVLLLHLLWELGLPSAQGLLGSSLVLLGPGVHRHAVGSGGERVHEPGGLEYLGALPV